LLQIISLHLNLLVLLVISLKYGLFQIIIGYAAIVAAAYLLRILIIPTERARLSSVFILDLLRLISAPANEASPVAGVATEDRDEEVAGGREIKDVLEANRTVDLLHEVLKKALLGLKEHVNAVFDVGVAEDS
jgi:hypothetical protein